MSGFEAEAIETVSIHATGELARRDVMSPYVWQQDDGTFAMLVRGVPKGGDYKADTGQVWYGTSPDGLSFTMHDAPVLAPGLDDLDIGGVEDPTLVIEKGQWLVYYTGVDAAHASGQMLYATGTGPFDLVKQGVALASSKTEGNTKEPTVNRTKDGHWRLFYEYAAHDASLIGLAIGDGEAGPWHEMPQPFAPRPETWDAWHLSTGPLYTGDKDRPVMFYNGATQNAHWRIGWVAFNHDYSQVVDRCVDPLIVPDQHPEFGLVDIAFAASCVVADGGKIDLYYSVEDRLLMRARLRVI